MAKKQSNNKEELGTAVKEPVVNLTHTALSVYKDVKTNKWHLAKIMYNPETGEVGEITTLDKNGSSKDDVLFRFKVTAAQEVFKD